MRLRHPVFGSTNRDMVHSRQDHQVRTDEERDVFHIVTAQRDRSTTQAVEHAQGVRRVVGVRVSGDTGHDGAASRAHAHTYRHTCTLMCTYIHTGHGKHPFAPKVPQHA